MKSVAWITEQKNTLSLVLYLAVALVYLDFDETHSRLPYAAAFALFLLCLLGKTVTVTPPAALRVTLAKSEQPTIHPQQTARVYQLTLSGQKVWNEAGPGFEAFYTLYAFPAE